MSNPSDSPVKDATPDEMAKMKKNYSTNWDLLQPHVKESPSEVPVGLMFRKLADTSKGERVPRFNPETGERFLVNPATGEAEPWPTLGWEIEGPTPQSVILPMSTVGNMMADPSKPVTLTNVRPVYKHGGPPENPLAVTHTFIHCDSITFNLVDRSVRYRVIHQPDKYIDGDQARVDWFYILELEAVNG